MKKYLTILLLVLLAQVLYAQTPLTAPGLASFSQVISGGGGGGFSMITSTNAAWPGSAVTTGAVNTTGANGIVIAVSGGTPTDNKGNTYTLVSDAGAVTPSVQLWFCASPTVGAGHTFTVNGNIEVIAFAKAGSAPAFDQETHGGHTGNWGAITIQPGSITTTSANTIFVSAIQWDVLNLSDSQIAIDSSFTKLPPTAWSTAGGVGIHIAYKIQTATATENPTWSESAGSNPDATCNMATFK